MSTAEREPPVENAEAHSTTVLYVRYSPKPDATEARTLEYQEAKGRWYCKGHDLNVVDVLADPDVSARKTKLFDRPGGAILKKLVNERRVRNVVATRLDRLFRNAVDGLMTFEWLRKKGVQLHLADEGGMSMCANTAVGRYMLGLLLCTGQFLPDLIAERTSQAMLQYQAAGRAMSSQAPFGQTLVKKKKRDGTVVRELVPNLEERAVIYEIMDMYSKGVTPRAIAVILNKQGRKCRTKNWRTGGIWKVVRRELNANV